MDEVTVTDAARRLPALLDRVALDGTSFRIVRRGRPVAELRPVRRSTAGQLRRRLREDPPDAGYWEDIRFARELPGLASARSA